MCKSSLLVKILPNFRRQTFSQMDRNLLVLFYFYVIILGAEPIFSQYLNNGLEFENTLFCADKKKCATIDQCPEILSLMNRRALPVHRFRHLVCGYVGSHPKVCCDVSTSQSTPTSTALGLRGESLPFNKNTGCGKSLIRSNIETLGTFPFVARIGFINVDNGRIKYPCSGVIVNERTVLTTGTCALATSNNYKLQTVVLGEFDEADNPDCNSLFCGLPTQEYNISYVVKHPDFRSDTFENNIALIRLQTTIDYTVTVQSICLLESENYNLVGKSPVLVGWGKISSQKEKSTQQQWLETKILPTQDCATFMNRGFSVELCAGSVKEPCSGFSGSPLALKYGDTYTLVGILSYGSDCEINSNSPSAYVSVAKYADWVLTNS